MDNSIVISTVKITHEFFIPMMDQINLIPRKERERWIEELRESIQLRSDLASSHEDDRQGDKYPMCCLGVLEHEVNHVPIEILANYTTPSDFDGKSFTVDGDYVAFYDELEGAETYQAVRTTNGLYVEDLRMCTKIVVYEDGATGVSTVGFVLLNDEYLTHPQIADLLSGHSVCIKYDEEGGGCTTQKLHVKLP